MAFSDTGGDLSFQEVSEIDEGIEADHALRISDKVRKRIDVVVVDLSVAVVDNVLDTADVDAGRGHDALDGFLHVLGRIVALDLQTGLRGFDGAGILQSFAARGLADVSRAQIESLSAEVNLNGVEIFAVQRLDAGDVATASGDEFLHQRNAVEAEGEVAAVDGFLQHLGRIEANDAGAAAADVRLDHDRIAQTLGRGHRLFRIVNHARTRIRKVERAEQGHLRSFGDFVAEGLRAVDDADAEQFQVGKVGQRMQNVGPVTATIC